MSVNKLWTLIHNQHEDRVSTFGLVSSSTRIQVSTEFSTVTFRWCRKVFSSGGSRISPRRGHQLPGGTPTYDFAIFSRKLHEIERIWPRGGGGGARPSHPPLDLPLFSDHSMC